MNKLDIARDTINKIDKQMAELFCERMQAVKTVAEYKKQVGMPIFDAKREEAIIKNNSKFIADNEIEDYYINFMRDTMKISRNYQSKLLSGMKVAFSGVNGAFAHIAAGKIFKDANRIPFSNFADAYNAVVCGECDCAVLPIENSNAGEVGQVIDLAFSGSLYINGIYELSVSQNLVGVKGTKISDIKRVVSHIQALEQCSDYIKKHGFDAVMCDNTAVAAQQVAENRDVSTAAIASKETAEIYGLEILDSDINESHVNTTRFAVFSRSNHIDNKHNDNHSIIMFTVRDEASALAKAINVIGQHKFNMQSLRSRSMKNLLWKYYFYIELEGNVNTENGSKMLEELSEFCDKLKVAGTFYNHVDLK